MAKYIRNTRTMKAALASEEKQFREQNPEGRFVYFNSGEDEPAKEVPPKAGVDSPVSKDKKQTKKYIDEE